MTIALMAKRTRYLKENPEGVSEMCREMEIMRDKSRAEGELIRARETARNLYSMGMDVARIAQAVNASIEQVKQWISPLTV